MKVTVKYRATISYYLYGCTKQNRKMKKILLVILILIVGFTYSNIGNQRKIAIKIKDKQSITKGDSHTYRIYTSSGVFENTDSIVFFKYNSSDVYNRLEKGKTYLVKVVGFRIPFLSKYPNIIKIYP